MKKSSKRLVALLTMSGVMFGSPVFATPGQYPSQQAQQQAQREAQARYQQNVQQQQAYQYQLQQQRDAYARQQQAQAREAANRANQERLQAELKSKRDREAWQESVRQERLARSLAEQQRIAKSDPTNSWQYKAVEKAAPVVKFTRDCASGAVVSGVMSAGNPYIMGCLLYTSPSPRD